MDGRVLIVAGSDSGGGTGIQADIKTVTALGGYAATAITALAAQNTRGVHGVIPVEPPFVARQMEVVLEDIGADCIKTGVLPSAELIEVVVRTCQRKAAHIPLVVDPMLAREGATPWLDAAAVSALKLRLLPLAALVTPSTGEAEALTGREVRTVDDLGPAADGFLALGAAAVLVKGGQLPGDTIVDLLRTADGNEHRFESSRIESPSTHGTGGTLASAIAAGVAQGLRLSDAVNRAGEYLREAIARAPGFGGGRGPLHHAHPFDLAVDPAD